MSRRLNAVDQVMGQLFERRRQQEGAPKLKDNRRASTGRRGSGSSSNRLAVNRMSRVGAQHGKAIFKLVTSGGTSDRSGLKGQLKYIFRDDKVAHIIDPSGRIEAHDEVSNEQINRLTKAWSNDWWKGTRNGQTSHMILSYPKGVSIEDVTEITRAVCNEKFNSGESKYDYVVAIHDDQEHHPHAHIVLNRRGSDNRLFQLRAGTENSYEGFREAMAAHAERRGIYLDPTSRFERGITARQPTRREQIEASKEGRKPQQRERTGIDLDYANEQIAFARIGYEAMAVVAANADCPRLEEAYSAVSGVIQYYNGDLQMPELSAEEYERFDQHLALLNESLENAQEVLKTKDAAARVPLEIRLSDAMKEFTLLNQRADYAIDLHRPANSKSLYMHEFVGTGENWPQGQERIEEIAQEYGLDGAAVVARLEHCPQNQYLERMWIKDDMERMAAATGRDLDKPEDWETVLEDLTSAHQLMRENLVSNYVLEPVPMLELDYHETQERGEKTQAERNADRHFGREVAQEPVSVSTRTVFNSPQEEAEFERRFTELANESPSLALLVSEQWDERKMPGTPPEGYLNAQERELLEKQLEISAAFDKWEARSPERYSLSKTAQERQEILNSLREHTTQAQYDRFRTGDLDAINHITTDPVFSRQLLMEVESHDRHHGFELTREQENLMSDNRDFLKEKFDMNRDRDYGYER